MKRELENANKVNAWLQEQFEVVKLNRIVLKSKLTKRKQTYEEKSVAMDRNEKL